MGGVCVMCMCLARVGMGSVGCQWLRELGLGFTNPGGTWGKSGLCFGCGVGGGRWAAWARVW